MTSSGSPPRRLRRELGVGAATPLGLGSILGTGVFVSIGIAAGVTGASVRAGLGSCLFLVLFVDPMVWLIGLGVMIVGLVWHQIALRSASRPPG